MKKVWQIKRKESTSTKESTKVGANPSLTNLTLTAGMEQFLYPLPKVVLVSKVHLNDRSLFSTSGSPPHPILTFYPDMAKEPPHKRKTEFARIHEISFWSFPGERHSIAWLSNYHTTTENTAVEHAYWSEIPFWVYSVLFSILQRNGGIHAI